MNSKASAMKITLQGGSLDLPEMELPENYVLYGGERSFVVLGHGDHIELIVGRDVGHRSVLHDAQCIVPPDLRGRIIGSGSILFEGRRRYAQRSEIAWIATVKSSCNTSPDLFANEEIKECLGVLWINYVLNEA